MEYKRGVMLLLLVNLLFCKNVQSELSIRLIIGAILTHFSNLKGFKKLQTYKLHVSLFMFDLQSGALPTSFKQFIPRDANDYTSTIITRQHDNIQRQRPRTTFSSKLPKHNFIKIWNSIDESTRNKKSRHIFKCILTKQFIAQYKTNVKCTNRRCRDCYNNNI